MTRRAATDWGVARGTAQPLLSQALVFGDRRPYLVALLTLDEQAAADRERR